ncbi:AAA family ATPase [Paenibacillus sp. GP183]|uniref:AAA family ATPase n=1 Tax=Paenibacillus sp. GP183 TaxID=1882751 RepID=UPI00089C9C2A|nr:AAA family ATPase [Paenibacillus sp. GP183]SED14627.1 AAA domain (dynein-related subfamily) [Paenibacillus sp. GP183]
MENLISPIISLIDEVKIDPGSNGNIRKSLADLRLYLLAIKKEGDLFKFLTQYISKMSDTRREIQTLMKSRGIKPLDQVFRELLPKIQDSEEFLTLADFQFGEYYSPFEIALFSEFYNIQNGIYPIKKDINDERAIFIKATLEDGMYSNKWIIEGVEMKYFAKQTGESFNHISNQAIIESRINGQPIYLFVKDSTVIGSNKDLKLIGKFEFVDENWEGTKKWFKLRKADQNSISISVTEKINMKQLIQPYSIEDALQDSFLERHELESMLEVLKYKRNLILQGPPGVGKTYLAKKLGFACIEEKDDERLEMIQFHQSYSYEDFIRGYRPSKSGQFELNDGIFYTFCKNAENTNNDKKFVFIIDEINRGNLSKIFGELMLLIEKGKRGKDNAIHLTYRNENEPHFYVPDNIYIIGTMNTADRSLSIVDFALRRRFAFISLESKISSMRFKQFLLDKLAPKYLADQIVNRIKELNETILRDKTLGRGYEIGHSYFCPSEHDEVNETWYEHVVKNEIKPLLEEYWYDQPDRVEDEVNKLIRRE